MPKKKRRHQFVITIVADKACTSAGALSAVKNCIHGEFYGESFSFEPELFKVASFVRLPKRYQKAAAT